MHLRASSWTLTALALAACAHDPPKPDHPVVLFSDRRDPRVECVIVVRHREAVGQIHNFPGYAHPKVYVAADLGEALAARARDWARHPGDVTPPFPPPGPLYACTGFPDKPDAQPETAWFRNDNDDFRALFADLRARVIADANRREALPEWVMADPRLREQFGHFSDAR